MWNYFWKESERHCSVSFVREHAFPGNVTTVGKFPQAFNIRHDNSLLIFLNPFLSISVFKFIKIGMADYKFNLTLQRPTESSIQFANKWSHFKGHNRNRTFQEKHWFTFRALWWAFWYQELGWPLSNQRNMKEFSL